MKKAVWLVLISFFSLVDAVAQYKSDVQTQLKSDEYNVYKVVLNELFIKPDSKQLIIRKFTRKSRSKGFVGQSEKNILLSPGRENIAVELETIKNYNALNQESVELKNNFNISTAVNLLTDAELQPALDSLKADGSGKAYEDILLKKYETTTIIGFSRIGFNKSKNQALIHVEYMCGSVCGSGKYIILSKKNDAWIIARKLPTWIS